MNATKKLALSTTIAIAAIANTVQAGLTQTFEEYKTCTCELNNSREVRCYGCTNYPHRSIEPNGSEDYFDN